MHHSLNAEPLVHRWNNAASPRLTVESGDTVTIQCADSSGGQVCPEWTTEDFIKHFDPTRVHALTGPVAISGARPGDMLEIGIEHLQHRGWAWSSIIPGLGLLAEDFPKHHLFIWKLEYGCTKSLPGTTIDLQPFAGVIGVQRAEPGEFRTRAPGVFGGNMDVRDLCAGSTLFLPVLSPGAGLLVGDCHAAQGDGEVCINGMEAPMEITVRFRLHAGRAPKGPYALSPGRTNPLRHQSKPWHLFVESDIDMRQASKRAVRRAIEFVVTRLGIAPELAYILCSVALDLKISQLVNEPTSTITACLPDAIFD